MKTEIETAIKIMAERVDGNLDANEALKFTQAVLNLAHARATIIAADTLP